ncbi:MAG: hypothetical protein RL167_563 [Actinomycetota bacterium]|jgi:hypothetical protein
MAKTPKTPKKADSAGKLVALSALAAVVIGLFVWGGVRSIETTLIWAGVTFIVSLVGIATLALSVKMDDSDPNEPKLK